MTYNALADAYAHTWGGLYPYLCARDADVNRRLPRAMEDVADADPDVVCLQEIDRKWYDLFWLPQMRAAGFEPADRRTSTIRLRWSLLSGSSSCTRSRIVSKSAALAVFASSTISRNETRSSDHSVTSVRAWMVAVPAPARGRRSA